jgi:hypothetical protein
MKSFFVWATVFVGLGLLRALTQSIAPSGEPVLVRRVSANTVVIVRDSAGGYVIEKGGGCASLDRFVGKRVVLDAPELFLDGGARLRIPDVDQNCPILTARTIDPWDLSRVR